MKIAPVLKAIKQSVTNKIKYRLIHTGQHSDCNMSDTLSTQLGIAEPNVSLRNL